MHKNVSQPVERLGVFLALLVLIMGVFATPTMAAEREVVIDVGHADVLTVVPNGPTVSLVSKEDVTTPGTPTFHNPSRIIFGVKESAWSDATASVPGVKTSGYALGQANDPALLWPGWDSQAVAPLGATSVRFVSTEVTGPGDVYLWMNDATGKTFPLFGKEFKLRPGSTMQQPEPAHQHANWLFTKAGTYQLSFYAEVDTPQGTLRTDVATFTFAVGSKTPVRHTPTKASQQHSERVKAPAPAVEPAPVAQDQNQDVKCIPTPVKTEGGVRTKVGGSHTIPPNTHVHPNWVFTEPGTYHVSITQTAQMKSGKTARAAGTLTFQVGQAGNANSGHFDVGTSANAHGITMMVKDDRQQPARWSDPRAFAFGVGKAAEVTAPAGIEFIAPAGQKVWMISSTQVPSVPWVGANTMHPDLLKHTTGAVTWRLDKVIGPGALAVFESGNFGQIVGKHWFGGAETATGSVTYVGKTADGEDCDLDQAQYAQSGGYASGQGQAQLSYTGSRVIATGIASCASLLIGTALVMLRRRSQQ